MNNVELLQQTYQNFAIGNVEAVLVVFHPEIEWSGSKGFPYIPDDAPLVGPNAVVQNVFARIPEFYESFTIDIQELFGSEDKVVMKGYYKGVYKPTGKEFKANAAHIWTVKNGKITGFFQAVDTAVITIYLPQKIH